MLELLLSEHDGDCQTCVRSADCELRRLAEELNVTEIRYEGEKTFCMLDDSTPALVRNTGKCVSCRRCVTVCSQTQGSARCSPQNRGFDTLIGPAFAMNLSDVICVQCGQCAAVCPVGAITEKSAIEQVWAALDDPTKHVIVETAPAIRAALGEEFGYEPGTLVTGKMVSALRRLGFDGVFDTNFAADLTIMEEGTELLTRLKDALVEGKDVALPMFTSCSPGWINYMEHYNPDMLDNLSTLQVAAADVRRLGEDLLSQEAGHQSPRTSSWCRSCPARPRSSSAPARRCARDGRQDVDFVLTTRELARMIKQAGIDFRSLPEQKMDAPLGISTGAADIFATTGGVMEAALRTAYEIVTGQPFPFPNLHVAAHPGLEGVKEASVTIEETVPEWSFLKGATLNVAVANGLANAQKVIDQVKSGEKSYHFIEVMTCPGGCIGGGGQPRLTTDEARQARIRAIYEEDEGRELRKSHENPEVLALYDEYLGEPTSHLSHELLHTKYTQKDRV